MSLISLVIILIVIGFLLWAVNRYIPMEQTIRRIINAVVIIAVIIWLLGIFGILPDLNAIQVGK